MEENRLRSQIKGVESWRDYKAVRLQGIYYGTFFQSNLSLSDWVNSQRLLCPLVLGDGHDGVWNLFEEIGSTAIRQEILDWYHLKENLYKVGGSLKRLKAADISLARSARFSKRTICRFEKSLHKILSAILKAFRTNR